MSQVGLSGKPKDGRVLIDSVCTCSVIVLSGKGLAGGRPEFIEVINRNVFFDIVGSNFET